MLAAPIVVLVAAYYARHPKNFPPVRSPATFFNNLAADGVLAVGMMMMIGGLFDLSIGSLFALGGVLTALFATDSSFHWPLPLAMFAWLLGHVLRLDQWIHRRQDQGQPAHHHVGHHRRVQRNRAVDRRHRRHCSPMKSGRGDKRTIGADLFVRRRTLVPLLLARPHAFFRRYTTSAATPGRRTLRISRSSECRCSPHT